MVTFILFVRTGGIGLPWHGTSLHDKTVLIALASGQLDGKRVDVHVIELKAGLFHVCGIEPLSSRWLCCVKAWP
jgi:hypothetical protein